LLTNVAQAMDIEETIELKGSNLSPTTSGPNSFAYWVGGEQDYYDPSDRSYEEEEREVPPRVQKQPPQATALHSSSEESSSGSSEEGPVLDHASEESEDDLGYLFEMDAYLKLNNNSATLLNQPLYPGSSKTLRALLLQVAEFAITTKAAQSQIEKMLTTLKEFLPQDNLVPNYAKFREIVVDNSISVCT
jgi:hypothetical protein